MTLYIWSVFSYAGVKSKKQRNDPMQAKKVPQVTGEWWRWSSYTILDGVIVPEEGATLEAYDPWKVYFQNVGRYRTVEQPYVSLLELNRLRPPPFRPLVHPSLTPSRLMLNWCSQYGHLGILPTLANSIQSSRRSPRSDTRGGGIRCNRPPQVRRRMVILRTLRWSVQTWCKPVRLHLRRLR